MRFLAAGLIACRIKEHSETKKTEQIRKDEEQRKIDAAKQKEIEDEKRRKIEEETYSKNSKIIAEQSARDKLIDYASEILSYVTKMASDKNNSNLLMAVNDTINRLVKDSDIKPEHYQEAIVKKDLELIMAALNKHDLSDELVVKRLKNLLDVNNVNL